MLRGKYLTRKVHNSVAPGDILREKYVSIVRSNDSFPRKYKVAKV